MSGEQQAQPKARDKVAGHQLGQELLPDQSRKLLHELHLLTPQGDLNADARRKLKQINHLVGLLRPALLPLFGEAHGPTVIDAGSGNGYLGFLLYEMVIGPAGFGQVIALETRAELVQRATERAVRLGYTRIEALHTKVAEYVPRVTESALAVTALHACDTATDDAIALGIANQAAVIAVVPCCQAELARLLASADKATPLHALWRHPIQRREFAAHLTNVVRALVLESHGYQVTVTELVGWEHSLKNELILARKIQRGNGLARKQLAALLAQFPVLPMQLLTNKSLDDSTCGD